MPSNILLITMGGTIDALAYSEKEGEYPINATMPDDSHALKAMENICSEINLTSIAICNKDSKDLKTQDQEKLFQTIKNNSSDRIIVTIGTDRMCEIAQNIQNKHLNLGCPVIFTGAIWPLYNGDHSDGWNNLKQAAFSNPKLAPDIYIAMGDIFTPANQVKKDFENKIFIDTKNLTNHNV